MASPQALGSGLSGYNPFLPSDTNAKLRQIQLQQQLGQELQQQGLTPIDTNNRQIGNIGYAISPTEGIAKLAQALVGGYEQNNANDKYADALKNMGGASGQSGAPTADMMAALYPEEAAKAMLGDHRPGASYWTPSGVQQSPTDLQINTGTAPNSPPQPAQGDPGGGAPAPQVPVQGPVPAAPIPGVPSTAPDPLAQYRQANGMATPPIDPQRQAMGLPTGSNIPMGNPQVNASQLSAPPVPPQPASSVPLPNVPQGTIPTQTALPTPMPGESPLHFQARLDVAKDVSAAQAKAPIAAAQAGATTAATDTATNLADAQKTFNVAAGNFPRAMQRFNQLRDASKVASYGGGVSDQEPEQGLLEHFLPGPDYARNFARSVVGNTINPAKATANQTIEQAASQGIMAELAPQLAGLQGNKFLESIASGASGLNPADPPGAKLNAINGLQDQYIGNMRSLAQQRRSYGDPAAPSDMDLAQMISQNSPTASISIIAPDGTPGRVNAAHLPDLIQSGGQFK